MNRDARSEGPSINADMTILDVVSRYGQTEAVFRQYDERAGVCLCCEALFETLKDVAHKYGLDLKELVAQVNPNVA